MTSYEDFVKSYLSENEEQPVEDLNNHSREADCEASVNTSITTSEFQPPRKKNPFTEPKPTGRKRKSVYTDTPIDKRRKLPMVGMSGAETDVGCAICKDTIVSIRSKRVLVQSTLCGHEFCQVCLMQWKNSGQNKGCPICVRKLQLGSTRVLPLLGNA